MGGAQWLTRMRRIVLPLIRPAMVGGWVLIFVTLMKEFSSSVLLGSPAVPVNATVLWGFWSLGHYGALAAFEVVNTLIMAVIAGIVLMFDGRRLGARAS
jgi:iron(III) transport system permease protein